VLREDVSVSAEDLLRVPTGEITEAGVRENIRVGIQYIEAWLRGQGCVPLYHLMEDAATAEICRSQIWQWIAHGAKTVEGVDVGRDLERLIREEMRTVEKQLGSETFNEISFAAAAKLFTDMVTRQDFDEFLTLPAYEALA
jgi:malate synthase